MRFEGLSGLKEGQGQRRLALAGLALVLIFLATSAILGSYYSYSEGAKARTQTQISNQYKQARFAIASEDSLASKYAANPTSEIRLGHQKTRRAFETAINAINVMEGSVATNTKLMELHQTYVQTADRYFDLVDQGERAAAEKLAISQLTPAFGNLEIAVVVSALRYHNASMAHLTGLVEKEKRIAVLTAFVFIVGLFLVAYFVTVLRRLTEDASAALARENLSIQKAASRLQSLVQNASDVILICDQDGNISYQSSSASLMWKYPDDALIATPFSDLIPDNDRASFQTFWSLAVNEPGSTRKLDLPLRTLDGDVRTVSLTLRNLIDHETINGVVVTAQDITERKQYEEELAKKAFFDSLTNLPNRALLQDRLKHALSLGHRAQTKVAVLFADIDNFKHINDSLGHAAGDELIIAAAQRLLLCCNERDTVARFGGDEFVILREEISDVGQAEKLASDIINSFRDKFVLNGKGYGATLSIGIAIGDASVDSAEFLIRNADIAMYKAKAAGKGRYVIFENAMHMSAVDRLDLVRDLQDALMRNELYLNYQPILDLKTGNMVEAEALLRWKHPVRGNISPAEFIPMAEGNGLILAIGQWVLEEACSKAARWPENPQTGKAVSISVNLSTLQFQQPSLIANVLAALTKSGLPADRLKLEVTESAIMQNVDATIETLGRLKDLGVAIAIDDFGTGYSSLSYLKNLPLDVLKIDRSFINGITDNKKDVAIVLAIVTLAKTLNLSITAEGIETRMQSELLKNWQVERGQGYLYSRPLGEADVISYLLSEDTRLQNYG